MKVINIRSAMVALGALLLVVPATALAHPSMYLVTAKIAAPAEIQTITVDATGGTYKPSAGAKTIPYNAPAWRVEDALGADPAIGRNATTGANLVLVTGPDGGPYTLRYQGSLATTNVAQVVPNSTGLTGGTATATGATVSNGSATPVTFTTDATGATMQNSPLQAVIANDGYPTMWTESNGLADHGWLNLKYMPTAYRAPMTASEWLNYGPAQTSIQTHATCQNVPALNTDANALAVQANYAPPAVGDPFWNYVPWQKTAVPTGGDNPTQWIPVVQAAVGVNLNSLTTVAEFRTACEALNGGQGVYVPADTQGGNQATSAIADAVTAAVAPLNTQITTLNGQIVTLNGQITTLNGQVTTLTADNAALTTQVANLTTANTTLTAEKAQLEVDLEASETARLALINRPLELTLGVKKFQGKVVFMVTGPLNQSGSLKLQISEADRKKLKLPSRIIASQTRAFGSKGAVLVTLTPGKSAAKAIAKRTGSTKVTILATSGVLTDSASATITG